MILSLREWVSSFARTWSLLRRGSYISCHTRIQDNMSNAFTDFVLSFISFWYLEILNGPEVYYLVVHLPSKITFIHNVLYSYCSDRTYHLFSTVTLILLTFCDAPFKTPRSHNARFPVGSSSTSSVVSNGRRTYKMRPHSVFTFHMCTQISEMNLCSRTLHQNAIPSMNSTYNADISKFISPSHCAEI